ncbi:hypothetical protein ACFLZZ_01635 [Nanoarchaeota archaeon]
MVEEKAGKETKLGGNIALVGFEILEPVELIVIKKMVGNYVRKLGNNGKYKEMRLTLQQHPHGKSFKHEIQGLALFEEGRFHSEAMEWNIYNALAQVCDKLLEQSRKKEDITRLKKQEGVKEQ